MADRSPGLFDVDARLAEISAKGDGLERIAAVVDFEVFRPRWSWRFPGGTARVAGVHLSITS